jgi:hypothetical protein
LGWNIPTLAPTNAQQAENVPAPTAIDENENVMILWVFQLKKRQ